MEQLIIKTYCHIKNNHVYINGQPAFDYPEANSMHDFLKKAFKHFKPGYAKFYKMDDISKLGFLASEVILKDKPNQNCAPEDVGIVISNSQSTLVTDTEFQASIEDDDHFFPSPSVFVYTLPNIMMGEISIRHGFRGENAFYIFENFNANFVADYINQLFLSQKLKACIGGWVDQSSESYEAFIYWADDQKDGIPAIEHSGNEIERLYNLIR
ncbi:MAG: 3-oxoacyl-ACP synthase [Bacteroidetes bacterium]|nr:3-oxoacyl-ACP synthase [Bacteroidota bacterium]